MTAIRSTLVELQDPRPRDVRKLLIDELEICESEEYVEAFVFKLDKDGAVSWSYTASDDMIRTLGALEMVKQEILCRMSNG